MLPNRLEKVTQEDILGLIANQIPEGSRLDYKGEFPHQGDSAKAEFLEDVVSFANAAGGDIIFGIAEKKENGKSTGLPEKITELKITTPDEAMLRLQAWARSGIDPKPLIKIHTVMVQPPASTHDVPVIIVRIPASSLAPHMLVPGATDKIKPLFFMRHNGGKHPMDMNELRTAFFARETGFEKVSNYLTNRVNLIGQLKLQPDTPQLPAIRAIGIHPIASSHPLIVLQVFPFNSFSLGSSADIRRLHNHNWQEVTGMRGHSLRRTGFNADGYLIQDFSLSGNGIEAYVQFFRFGGIETVFEVKGTSFISINDIRAIASKTRGLLDIQEHIGVRPPLLLSLTVVSASETYIGGLGKYPSPPDALDISSGQLYLPYTVVEDWDVAPEVILRPTLDALWQAAGAPYCPLYDEDGKPLENLVLS